MMVVKIDTKQVRTEEEYEKIFEIWTNQMNQIYENGNRKDARTWKKSPKDWMEPFNSNIYKAWLAFDREGDWRSELKEETMSLLEAINTNNSRMKRVLQAKAERGDVIRII